MITPIPSNNPMSLHYRRSSIRNDQPSAEEQSLELEDLRSDSSSLIDLDMVTHGNPVDSTTPLAQTLSRSSSSSSTSPRDRGVWALRGRIASLSIIPFQAIDAWKQKSRFNGWKWGVLTGSAVCLLVLMINCTFVLVGALTGQGYNDGIATIFAGNASEVSQMSTLLHIIINVLSTLLLSASNYAMQGNFLDIGILSVRNIRSISLRRKMLWFFLCISSIPLHLLYNASVFQVVVANDYYVDFVDRASPAWQTMNQTQYKNYLSVNEIKNNYDQDYVSARGDIVLWVEKLRFEYENVNTFNRKEKENFTFGEFTIPVNKPIDPKSRAWAQAIDATGWVNAATLNEYWNTNTNSTTLMLRIAGAFAQPKTGSEVQISLTFLAVVIVCNAIKFGCLVFLLWRGTDDTSPPLVTIGDAIASFLEAPDRSTCGYSTYSKAEFFWKTGRLKRTWARQQDGRAAKWDKRCEGIWEERTNNYGSAISKRKRVFLTFIGFGVPFTVIMLIAAELIPFTAWATASPLRFSAGSQKFDGNTTAQLAFIANSPQLLLSVVYLYFNNMFTSMALAYEWGQFGIRRKGLRVTKPRGKQRETYFLQLPLKVGVPLNALSGLLHWLASQMLFVLRIDQRNHDGVLDPNSSLAACGFSSSALLALSIVLIVLSALIPFLGFWTSAAHIPFSGSCSWVISAACHPSADEAEPSLGRVKWGSISEGGRDAGAVGHCSFSSGRVTRPKFEEKYI